MPQPHAALDDGVITAWYGPTDRPDLTLPPLPLG
jgi:hypothetical protein